MKIGDSIREGIPLDVRVSLSLIRAHRLAALLLIVIALVSTVLGYFFTTSHNTPCPLGTRPFQEDTVPPRAVFQLVPPVDASICLTIRISGIPPPGGISLAPTLGLYTSSDSGSTWSACSNSWTNCGGLAVSATPPSALLPMGLFQVVTKISAPAGSTRGVYMLWFWACSGGTVLWLRVGGLNQTLQNTAGSTSACPFTRFHVALTFKGYAGIIPVYRNGTTILPL